MIETRALLGPTSGGMARQGLERLLVRAVDIDIVHAHSWDDVVARLRAEHFDVLIAKFSGDDALSMEVLRGLQDDLAIVAVDFEQLDTVIHVRNPGTDQLVALVRICGGQTTRTGPADPALVGFPAPSSSSFLLTPFVTHSEQIDELLKWLDLKLSILLASSEAGASGQDIAGWTMSYERARALLGENNARQKLADLETAYQAADLRLQRRTETGARGGNRLPLSDIADFLQLDSIERQILLLTLAPDIDDRYARVYGYLNDDLARRRPTLALLAALIDEAPSGWRLYERMVGNRQFARLGLVGFDATDGSDVPQSQVALIVARDIVELVLSGKWLGPRDDGAALHSASPEHGPPDPDAAAVIAAATAAHEIGVIAPLIQLAGPSSLGDWLTDQLNCNGFSVVRVDVGRQAETPRTPSIRAAAWARYAVITDSVLQLSGIGALAPPERAALLRAVIAVTAPPGPLLVVDGGDLDAAELAAAPGGVLAVTRRLPSRSARAVLWQDRAAVRGIGIDAVAARGLAARFTFDRPQIDAAVAMAASRPEPGEATLREAGRFISLAAAPSSVRRIDSELGWDSIILPAAIKDELKTISAHISHGATVWDDWGFGARIPYGQGVAALFAGPSGTGKTMAAQIIASEMGVPLFQVDLSQTVSKFIGETEKALDRIFDAAETAGAVLLFDEADALFGKRSEVKDAHDRYANVEIAYLLQRMEAYRGLALLTTNMKQNIDAAFLRRLRFIVDFPVPDGDQRLAIWRQMFPAAAPLADGVDFAFLARRLPLSGGSIQQIALRAAFDAASSSGVIGMAQILVATRQELTKLGMQSAERSLPPALDALRSGAHP